MTDLNNIGDHVDGTLIAESQATKATTSNALDNLLSDATQLPFSITITANRTLTDDEFFGSLIFDLSGSPAADFSLFLPSTGDHKFVVKNGTGKVATVDAGTSGGTVIAIADGQTAWLHSDGTSVIRLSTAGVGLQTIWVPAAAMQPTVSNGCAALANVETVAGQPDQHVLAYDTAADEHAQFEISFPKSWNEGTITFKVFYTHQGGQTGGLDGVAWALQGVALSDSDPFATAYGTAVVVTADNVTGDDLFITATSTAITIAGTPAEGDMTVFRMFRDVSDAADDLDIDAQLVGIQIFFTTNAPTDD
jgi:hypothetical protein